MIFNPPWGRWGFGPGALCPTGGATRGDGQSAIGPVIALTCGDPTRLDKAGRRGVTDRVLTRLQRID